jgi:hypothetical protein
VRQIDHDARPVMTSLSMSRSPSSHWPANASHQHTTSQLASHSLQFTAHQPGRAASKVSHCRCCYTSRTHYLPRRKTTFPQRQCAAASSPTSTSISISFMQLEQGYEQTKLRGTHARTPRENKIQAGEVG